MTEQSSQHQVQGARQRLEEVSAHANMAVLSLNMAYDCSNILSQNQPRVPEGLIEPYLHRFKIPYHIAQQEIDEAIVKIPEVNSYTFKDNVFADALHYYIHDFHGYDNLSVRFQGAFKYIDPLPRIYTISHHYFDIRVGKNITDSLPIVLLWLIRHGAFQETLQHFADVIHVVHNTTHLWVNDDFSLYKLVNMHVYQLSIMSSFQHMIDHTPYDENIPLDWQQPMWKENFLQHFKSQEGLQQTLENAVIYGQHMVTENPDFRYL